MYCKNCNHKLSDTFEFCPYCGINLKNNSSESVQQNDCLKIFRRQPKYFINSVMYFHPLSLNLIDKYEHKWNFYEGLSNNEKLNWSVSLIEKYKSKWSFYGLSGNEGLKWDIDLLERYMDKWKWNHSYYQSISNNKAIPWNVTLIEKFSKHLYWGDLSRNPSLPWSLDFIDRYKEKINWNDFSWNPGVIWSESLLIKYMDKLSWKALSRNPSLPWSRDFIKKYESKLDWFSISSNPGLPWSKEFFTEFEDKLDWKYGIWSNEGIIWTEELFDEYKNRIQWTNTTVMNGLSAYGSLPKAFFFEKYIDRLNFEQGGLCNNRNFIWSLNTLLKYEQKWSWFELETNPSVWEKVFEPIVNEIIISEIMDDIKILEDPKYGRTNNVGI